LFGIVCKVRHFIGVAINLRCKKFCPLEDLVPSTAVVGHLSKSDPGNKIEKGLHGLATGEELLRGGA
jgi:hypothetical protein